MKHQHKAEIVQKTYYTRIMKQQCYYKKNNGRMSCGKGSKHIHIRYFFITDKIKQKELKVLHCPTKEMIADYYTKPLQGGQFYKFKDLILGINVKDMDKYKEEYKEAIASYGLTPTAAAVA